MVYIEIDRTQKRGSNVSFPVCSHTITTLEPITELSLAIGHLLPAPTSNTMHSKQAREAAAGTR